MSGIFIPEEKKDRENSTPALAPLEVLLLGTFVLEFVTPLRSNATGGERQVRPGRNIQKYRLAGLNYFPAQN